MLLITCPVCAVKADETEFANGGLYAQPGARDRYARGIVREWWLCESGCGSWFGMARHAGNQRIFAVWERGREPELFPGEEA
jgi:sarcosine oxidase delta subunit